MSQKLFYCLFCQHHYANPSKAFFSYCFGWLWLKYRSVFHYPRGSGGSHLRSFSLPVRVSFSEALMLIDGVYLREHFGSGDRKTTSGNIFIHLLITTLTFSLKTQHVAVEQDVLKSQRVVALF